MNRMSILVAGLMLAITQVHAGEKPWTKGEENYRPQLFKQFGDLLNTPDGLAIDKAGNVFLSAVNGVDASYPGHIWRMERQTGQWSVFTPCKPHPKTHGAFPMGRTARGRSTTCYDPYTRI